MQLRNVRLSVVCLLSLAWPALAQDGSGYTSVGLFKVKPDATAGFVENMKKFITPIGAKLLKDGTVSAYGLDIDMFHQPGATNAALWIEVADFAAFGKAEEAIQVALKASPQLATAIWAATDAAAHSDIMVRHLFTNMKPAPAGVLPYTNFYAVKVKPGKIQEFGQLFEKYQKPTYDKMVADGVILGYSVDTEAIHTEAESMVWIVSVLPDLAAKDKMLVIGRAVPDRRAMQVAMTALTVEGSHRDSISQAALFVTK